MITSLFLPLSSSVLNTLTVTMRCTWCLRIRGLLKEMRYTSHMLQCTRKRKKSLKAQINAEAKLLSQKKGKSKVEDNLAAPFQILTMGSTPQHDHDAYALMSSITNLLAFLCFYGALLAHSLLPPQVTHRTSCIELGMACFRATTCILDGLALLVFWVLIL